MLEEIEQVRKKALKKTLICFVFTIVLAIVLLIIFKTPVVLVFGLVVGIILSAIIPHKDTKKFKDLYKQNIVLATFNEICTDVQFDLNHGIDYHTIASTNMMYMGDRFSSNDHITGKYKNINFEMSDITIQKEETDSDGDTHYVTIFQGQWYIFDFNKHFKADIQVCDSRFTNAKRGSLFSKDKFHKVQLEDIEFNKKFKVFAQNELDAFYILTPNSMEKIKKLKDNVNGKLLLCFIDNKLHIALANNKDLFEASIFKKVELNSAQNKAKAEISIITNFIDILNLDNDLFKTNEGGE